MRVTAGCDVRHRASNASRGSPIREKSPPKLYLSGDFACYDTSSYGG
jgi:hypothetical protein